MPDQQPPDHREEFARRLDDFWHALVNGSAPDGGTVRTPAPDGISAGGIAPEYIDVSTPQPAGASTHSQAKRTAEDLPDVDELGGAIDNFELLRRLFQHRDLLAGELAKLTPLPQRTRTTRSGNSETTPPLRSLGDYQLLEQIGRGGMGVVYKARQRSLGRVVAVKHMRAGRFAYDYELQRFKLEVETAARLQHPGIVAIHEVGVEHGEPYFSMDYIDGPSLSALVREKILDPRRAARYVQAIARAVDYAHGRGVVHRDLKPANVLLNGADEPIVTDFGLAKQFELSDSHSTREPAPALTQTGDVVGTPSYMSPEQARGQREQVGPPTDIYALGAILYELVTGRPPFRAETSVATLQLVIEAEPVAPRLLNPEVPRDLENICLRCLAKEPERRYATALQLAEDLGRFLAGEAVHARPVSNAERLWRFCRRNPWLAGLSATAVALLLLIALVSTAAAYREAGLRKHAENQTFIADGERSKAVRARQEETNARSLAEKSRNLAQLELADNLLRRGITWCEQGEPMRGLLAFAQALEALPAERRDLPRAREIEQAARLNLTAWGHRVHQLLHAISPEGGVDAFAASEDGAWIISANSAGEAQVWDSATAKPHGKLLSHGGRVRAVAVSLDGQFAATGGYDEFVRLWNVRTGELLRKPEASGNAQSIPLRMDREKIAWQDEFYTRYPPQLSFTRDGQRLVTNCGQFPLIKVPSGEAIELLAKGYQHCRVVALTPDCRQMIAGYLNGSVMDLHLFDTADGGPYQGNPLKIERFWCCAFTPDGKRLTIGTREGFTHYDIKTAEPVGPLQRLDLEKLQVRLRGNMAEALRRSGDERLVIRRRTLFPGSPRMFDFHLQQPMMLIATADIAVGWNLEQNALTGLPLRHQEEVFLARFSAENNWAVTAGRDHCVRVWDLMTARRSGQALQSAEPVIGASFVNRSTRLAVATADGNLRIWSLAQRPDNPTNHLDHKSELFATRAAPGGDVAVTHGEDGSLKLWDLSQSTLRAELPKAKLPPFMDGNLLDLAHDGSVFCIRAAETKVCVYDTRTGSALVNIETPREILDLALSRTGRFLATTLSTQLPGEKQQSNTYEVLLWEARTGKRVGEPIPVCAQLLCFSPSEELLVTGSMHVSPQVHPRRFEEGKEFLSPFDHLYRAESIVHFWNTSNASSARESLALSAGPIQLAFSSDGRRLAMSAFDQSLRVFDLQTEQYIGPRMNHSGNATILRFAAAGRLLISGGGDGNVRLWRLDEADPTGPELTHFAEIRSLSLSPDESLLAVGCLDSVYRLWHLSTAEPVGPIQIGGPYIEFVGDRLLIGHFERALWLRSPPERAGSPDEISRWCREITGHTLDAVGRLKEAMP